MNRRRLLQSSLAVTAVAATPRITFAQSPAASPAAMATPVGTIGPDGHYPSGDPAVPDAWTKMPKPFKAFDGKPGKGSEIKALVMTYNQPPTPKDQNAFWKGLDERLGATWNPTVVPFASYGEKAAAVIASGDMGDLFYMNPSQTSTPLQKYMQEGAFTDLTEHLSGDNLKKYPNIAAFPDYMWLPTKMDGKIYGVPTPERRPGKVPAFRRDWSDKLIGKKPTNAEEMKTALIGMSKNDPDGNGKGDTWGISKYGTGWDLGIMHQMFNVPPLWRLGDDGSFQVQYSLPEYKEAVAYMRELFAQGAYHPDAAAMGFEDARALFRTGRSGLHNDGGAIYGAQGSLAEIRAYAPDAKVESLIPFNKDGGPGITYNGSGTFGFTAIPVNVDGGKIEELLRILDWMSAPFGSEEWLYKNFGNEGEHFEYNDHGFPVGNDKLTQENAGITGYMAGSPLVNWNADEPELSPLVTDEMKAIYSIGVSSPADGLYSPTMIDKGGLMFPKVTERLNEIVVGRQPIENVDKMLEDWNANGGEDVAKEYAEAYKKNQEG